MSLDGSGAFREIRANAFCGMVDPYRGLIFAGSQTIFGSQHPVAEDVNSSCQTTTLLMTCPKCGHEQADVFSQCQKCRYIFPRQPAKNPPLFTGSPTSPIAAGAGPSLAAMSGAFLGVIVLVVALWWLYTPEGLPVPEGSYINEKHHFAMSVPSGWMTLTKDNYREMFEKLGDKFPKSLQDGLSQNRIEVGFIKLLQEADFSPNINIVVVESEIPELDEKQKEEATQALTAEFSRVVDSYKLESSELTTVDELTSLQINSRAGLKLRVAEPQPMYSESTPEQWKTFDLKMSQTLVPGKKKAYILTCTAQNSQYPEYRRAFENSIESFRVLERPARFGPIVMGGIQGGLIASLGYLLYYLAMALIAFTKR